MYLWSWHTGRGSDAKLLLSLESVQGVQGLGTRTGGRGVKPLHPPMSIHVSRYKKTQLYSCTLNFPVWFYTMPAIPWDALRSVLYILWEFNIATGNGPFIVDLPITNGDVPYNSYVAMLVHQRVCVFRACPSCPRFLRFHVPHQPWRGERRGRKSKNF